MLTSLCLYRVKPGAEDAFRVLLARHWPTLRDVGLGADTPSLLYQGTEDGGGPLFVELLHWKDAKGPEIAHEVAEVLAIWEPMGALCEERGGRPAMEFPVVEKLDLPL
jgi:hypothetical protein